MGTIFRVLFYQPTFNLLILFYDLFSNNLGLAIIAVAVLSRVVTIPITRAQIKSAEKGKDLQKKFDKIKKKYKKNKDKMNEELAKLQAKYLPGQLAGCLPIILLIVLLIQVRAGIVNLVQKGWHAFNEVAYVESLKREEDYIKYSPDKDLEVGEHKLTLKVVSEDGNELEKVYEFEIVEDKEERFEQLTGEVKEKSINEIDQEVASYSEQEKEERASNISVYSDEFIQNQVSIPVEKFLGIFPTKSLRDYLFEDKTPEFEFFLRPPSNQKLITDETKVILDEEDITEKAEVNQGDKLNLMFLGINLSKVAADFSWKDPQIIPYAVLAVTVGASQFATSRILSGLRGFGKDEKKDKKKKKKKKKKKDDEEEMPDMAELMSMSSKQMMFIFPIFTIFTSLGYWGGANIFPAGLSLFWTVQSMFVIIQQVFMNREKALEWFRYKFSKEKEKNKKSSKKKSNK